MHAFKCGIRHLFSSVAFVLGRCNKWVVIFALLLLHICIGKHYIIIVPCRSEQI